MKHLNLLIEYRRGKPVFEPVHVELLADGIFRLLYSPGLVLGIAAGDEFRLVGQSGEFEITKRSGNLAIQVFSENSVYDIKEEFEASVKTIGGTLDGCVENGMVFTLPLDAGFQEIENLFNSLISKKDGVNWYYGNVYDPKDGVTPLNWWQSPAGE